MSHPKLLEFRNIIDKLDEDLIRLIGERFSVTRSVGHYKATHNLAAKDADREATQLIKFRQLAKDFDINPDFAEKLLRSILEEVVDQHQRVDAR